MNRLMVVGRVCKEAEFKYLKDGLAKLEFTVAVDRAYQKDKKNKKADFIPCVILGKRAEALSNYVTKGQQVAVQGELHIENIKKDDQWKTYVDLQVEIFEFIGSKKEEPKMDKKFEFQAINDDDLPF